MKFDCLNYEIVCPTFGLRKPAGKSDEIIVAELEQDAMELLGPWNKKEYDSFTTVCCHEVRINRCLREMGVNYGLRPVLAGPQKRNLGAGNVGSEVPVSKMS